MTTTTAARARPVDLEVETVRTDAVQSFPEVAHLGIGWDANSLDDRTVA